MPAVDPRRLVWQNQWPVQPEQLVLAGDVGGQSGATVLISLGFIVPSILGAAWSIALGARSVAGLVRIELAPVLWGAWLGRRHRGQPALAARGDLRAGTRVRLRGVVDAQRMVRAPLSGTGTVACAHAFGEAGGAVLGEGLAACDFLLRLADGTPVQVLAERAAGGQRLRLVDGGADRWRGKRLVGGWFRESRVVSGDEIEVIGRVALQVDPDAPRLGDREPPVCWTITAAPEEKGQPLILRFATRALAERLLPAHATCSARSSA
jgi:hypothetical protein